MAWPDDAPPLSAADVRVRWGGRAVLDGVTASLRPGKILGIVGPNGSGKTTLLRALAGLLRPDAGTVTLHGVPLDGLRRAEVAREVAIVLQENAVPFEIDVRDVVAMGRVPHRAPLQWDSSDDDAIVDDALDRTGMAAFSDRDFSRLSAGERQRVVLARALAQRPRVLLLDEPSSHLDVSAALQMMDLVRRLADEGVAVAAVLHDLNLALRYADDVLLMADGRAVATGPCREVLDAQRLADVYGVRFARHDLDGQSTLVPTPPAPARH